MCRLLAFASRSPEDKSKKALWKSTKGVSWSEPSLRSDVSRCIIPSISSLAFRLLRVSIPLSHHFYVY